MESIGPEREFAYRPLSVASRSTSPRSGPLPLAGQRPSTAAPLPRGRAGRGRPAAGGWSSRAGARSFGTTTCCWRSGPAWRWPCRARSRSGGPQDVAEFGELVAALERGAVSVVFAVRTRSGGRSRSTSLRC